MPAPPDPASAPEEAAIYYVPEGYSTAGPRLLGINAASEGFLRALAEHSGAGRLCALTEAPSAGEAFADAVRQFNPAMATRSARTADIETIAPSGVLQLPGPGLGPFAWMRRRVGARAFSLVGITHTTATPTALDAIADMLGAPVEPWDALVCPSQSVRAMTTRVLEEQRAWLEERFGCCPPGPRLPVIPLGVACEDFADDRALRAAWRAKLAIPEDEVVVLYFGRLNPGAKAHPIPLFLAFADAARRSPSPLHLVLGGWFADESLESAYRAAAEFACPDQRVTVVDGRGPARSGLWRAADIFVSPVDSVQETFGLTPVEAMAAGLPVIASDWNGYRETVRHGRDGVLVRTLAPPPGSGADLARAYSGRSLGYEQYVGASGQATAVDIAGLADAIFELANAPARRAEMGASGRAHAQANYDWRVVMRAYRELWGELDAARRATAHEPRRRGHPARPDPFDAFQLHASAILAAGARIGPGPTPADRLADLVGEPSVVRALPDIPTTERLADMLARIAEGPVRAEALIGAPPEVDPQGWRGLAFLIKYGLASERG